MDLRQSWETLAESFQDREERSGETGAFEAILGLPDGSIVADRPTRKVYIHTAQGDYGTAILGEGAGIPFLDVSQWAGTGVRCVFPPGEDSRNGTPHIVGLTTGGRISTNGVTPNEQLLRNALFPKVEQIATLRAFPTNPPSTSIEVRGDYLITHQDGSQSPFVNTTFDLGPTIDALTGAQHQVALVCYDALNDALVAITNTASAASGTLPQRGDFDIADFAALNTKGYLAVAGLYLFYRQAEIAEADFYRSVPTRPFLRHLALHNYTATTDPTTGDDAGDGYSAGSEWYNVSAGKAFDCFSAAVGAALWKQRSGVGAGAGTDTDQLNVLYVGKHGSDSNDGKSHNQAKLTIQAAIDTASAATPSATNRYAVVVVDAGVYTEDLTGVQYVDIDARFATLAGTLSMQGDSINRFYRVQSTGNGGILVQKSGANTTAYFYGQEVDGSAHSNVTNLRNLSNNGIAFFVVGKVTVGASGTGVGDQTNGIGHIHANIEDLYLAGNSAVGVAKTSGAGNVVIYVQHILETGSPTGTTGVSIGATGEVYLIANELIADTAYNITAGGVLRGFVGNLSGVLTGTAELVVPSNLVSSQTANKFYASPSAATGQPSFRTITKADITTALTTPPPIGATTPDTGKFTTLNTTSTSDLDALIVRTNGCTIQSGINAQAGITVTGSTQTTTLQVTSTSEFQNNSTFRRDGAALNVNFYSAVSGAGGSNFNTYHLRGSWASPSAIIHNDELGNFNFAGYDGSTVTARRAAVIGQARASGGGTNPWSGTDQGARIVMQVTPAGTTATFNAFILSDLGEISAAMNSADTNSVRYNVLQHNTSGSVAAGLGTGLEFQAESSTTNNQSLIRLRGEWVVATHASRTARGTLSAFDTAERTCFQWEASGSAAMLGFFGTAPIVKPAPTGSRGGNAALASLLTALANLGLITDSTSA